MSATGGTPRGRILNYYVHDLDPVLLHLWGPLAIRWYGLAYIAGVISGYFLLDRWGRRGRYPLAGEELQRFMVAIVIGIMAGGRFGHVLFYDWVNFSRNPLVFFKLWEGGMASHGGMMGLAVAAAIMSRRLHAPLLALTDGLAAVAPIGLGLGRLANFINGELWGRVTTVPWAMIFPQEAGYAPGETVSVDTIVALQAQGYLLPRHPSQLYQATLEGALLLVVLLLAYRSSWARAASGRISGLFLGLYAVVRFASEFLREPEIVHFGWLTQGQLLSLLLLLPGSLYLIGRTYIKRA